MLLNNYEIAIQWVKAFSKANLNHLCSCIVINFAPMVHMDHFLSYSLYRRMKFLDYANNVTKKTCVFILVLAQVIQTNCWYSDGNNVADLFLFCYERDFMKNLSKITKPTLLKHSTQRLDI